MQLNVQINEYQLQIMCVGAIWINEQLMTYF